MGITPTPTWDWQSGGHYDRPSDRPVPHARLFASTLVRRKNAIILCKDISFRFCFEFSWVTRWLSVPFQNGPNGVAKRSFWERETVRFARWNGLFCNAKWHVWESCKINSEIYCGKRWYDGRDFATRIWGPLGHVRCINKAVQLTMANNLPRLDTSPSASAS